LLAACRSTEVWRYGSVDVVLLDRKGEVPEPAECQLLELSDMLPREVELFADLFERVGGSVVEAAAKSENAALAVG